MFLTPVLERLIFRNKATYKQITCANGTFFSFPIVPSQTVIVIGVEWTPFIAPIQTPLASVTVADWLSENEYQLRVDDSTSKNLLHYRNNVKIDTIDETLPVVPSDTLDKLIKRCIIQPGDKVLTPVYWIYNNAEVRIVVTRTRGLNSNFSVSVLTSGSKEKNTPEGVKNLQIISRQENGLNVNYVPPIYPKNSVVAPAVGIPGQTEGYYSAYETGCEMQRPDLFGDISAIPAMSPFFTLHYVVLKENVIGTIE